MEASESKAEQASRKKRPSVVLRDKGVVTIPLEIREQLKLETGDVLLVSAEGGVIVLEPATLVPRDQLRGFIEGAVSAERLYDERFPQEPPGSAEQYGMGPNVRLCAEEGASDVTAPKPMIDPAAGIPEAGDGEYTILTAPVKTGRSGVSLPDHVLTGREQSLPFTEGEP